MSYNFFQNKECEYFPCHPIKDSCNFSCLFCFCPLYSNMECGGQFHILDNGCKDCSNCTIPHYSYDYVIQKLRGEKEVKRFTEKQIHRFKEMVQRKLPNYILSDVTVNDTSGYMKTSLQFPDGSKVSYVYQLQDDTQLTEELAGHCIRCALDISMTNINSHLKLLQNLINSL